MDATFDDVVKLAEQLDVEHQNLLIYRLRVKQMREQTSRGWVLPGVLGDNEISPDVTRDELLQLVEQLRTMPVNPQDDLLGKYAKPDSPEMTAEEFHAQLHAIATEWKQEIDDISSDDH